MKDAGLSEEDRAYLRADGRRDKTRWYEPSRIMVWSFIGAIPIGAAGAILGTDSDVGSLFFLLALLLVGVGLLALLGVLVVYMGAPWTWLLKAQGRRDTAMRLARRIGQAASFRREAWRYALWSRSYQRHGKRTRALVSAGAFLILLFLVLAGLAVRQWTLTAPIDALGRAQGCGLAEAMMPAATCQWAGNARVIGRIAHSSRSHNLWLRMPDGTEQTAYLGSQDLPSAKPGDLVGALVWRGQVTEVDGYGQHIWTSANPKQQRITTWEFMAAVITLILLMAATVFYRYLLASGGTLNKRAA